MTEPSLSGRAFRIALLTIGAYVLVALFIGVLLILPVLLWRYVRPLSPLALVFCYGIAFALIRVVLPGGERFKPSWPELRLVEQPRLFKLLWDVADATGQRVPSEVYLVPEANAWIAQRGGNILFGGRRVLAIGLPLLQLTTVSQLRAILAHEFGHSTKGDVVLGPWIYRTRAKMVRAAEVRANQGILRTPFRFYSDVFVDTTFDIVRRQELIADRVAADVAGVQATVAAFRRKAGGEVVFERFWNEVYQPMVKQGLRPPLLSGFARYIRTETVAKTMEALADQQFHAPSDYVDTHPPLKQRVAALQGLPATSGPIDERPAIDLLEDAAALSEQLVSGILGKDAMSSTTVIDWDADGAPLFIREWEQFTTANAGMLADLTTTSLPKVADRLGGWAMGLADQGDLYSQDPRVRSIAGARLLGAALGLALYRRGWSVKTAPGEPIMMERDGHRIEPFEVVRGLNAGSLRYSEWRRQCINAGIDGLSLDPADAHADGMAGTEPASA